jgi:hypothetical protein
LTSAKAEVSEVWESAFSGWAFFLVFLDLFCAAEVFDTEVFDTEVFDAEVFIAEDLDLPAVEVLADDFLPLDLTAA